MLANVLEHRAQVFQVEQRKARIVCDLEDEVEHARLDVVELEHARQHQRAHVGHRGPHGVAALAVHIPQRDGAGGPLRLVQAALLQARLELVVRLAGLRNAGQITFCLLYTSDAADEHRDV